MSDVTVHLTGKAARIVERLVADGGFSTPEEALAAVLNDYAAIDDPALEHWLREIVVARHDAAQADPARGVSVDEARRALFSGE